MKIKNINDNGVFLLKCLLSILNNLKNLLKSILFSLRIELQRNGRIKPAAYLNLSFLYILSHITVMSEIHDRSLKICYCIYKEPEISVY